MKNHNSGNSRFMALKLDMSKAYDRVKWSFLKAVMSQMGFNDRWIGFIMEYVTTVTYSIVINGKPSGEIRPGKGIRQGDLLSPYLFLLCSEGLHKLIQKAAKRSDIHGVSICRNGPKLIYLSLQMTAFCFARLPLRSVKR